MREEQLISLKSIADGVQQVNSVWVLVVVTCDEVIVVVLFFKLNVLLTLC